MRYFPHLSTSRGLVGRTLKPTFIQKDQLGRFLRDKHLLELLKIFSPLGRILFRVPQSYFCVTFN